VIGAGFWSRFQIPAWRELPGVEVVGVCDRDRSRAEALAAAHRIPLVHEDPEALLAQAQPDAVDLVTPPDTHVPLAELALARGIAVVTQKPLAPSVAEAERAVACAEAAGRPLLVHENFRWQAPIRALKAHLDGGEVGAPFRARIQFSCSFPVFDNQPGLRALERFILLDLGVHLLDVARFLFGEVQALWCRTARVNPGIRGEDVATVLLDQGDVHTTVKLSYASRLAEEAFPESFALVEAERGSLELRPGYRLRVTTAEGTREEAHPPPRYAWADPAYDVVHASMVPCLANLLAGLRGEARAETDGHDNLRTLRLVEAAYAAAARGEVVRP